VYMSHIEGLLVDEDGIWQDDADNNVLQHANSGLRSKRRSDDINISELEASRSTSAQGSDVFKSVSAFEALDELQLPELATGYCTSESDLRHIVTDDRRYDSEGNSPVFDDSQSSDESINESDKIRDDNAKRLQNYAMLSSYRLQQASNYDYDMTSSANGDRRSCVDDDERLTVDEGENDDDDDNSTSVLSNDDDDGVVEFERLELALVENTSEERSQNTARSQSNLPAYVRRSAGQMSPDQSPDRATGNFRRTYTVRQSKRGREKTADGDPASSTRTARGEQPISNVTLLNLHSLLSVT
jgi:hypothetical protein